MYTHTHTCIYVCATLDVLERKSISLQKLSAFAADIQQRCFSASPLSFAAAKVAMSKFDTTNYLPYDKLEENLKVVRKR